MACHQVQTKDPIARLGVPRPVLWTGLNSRMLDLAEINEFPNDSTNIVDCQERGEREPYVKLQYSTTM